MRRLLGIIILLCLIIMCQGQVYYNLQHSWEEIDGAVSIVLDSLNIKLGMKLDKEVKGIRLPDNAGVPILVNLRVTDSPLNSEHGYIFAVDDSCVLRIAAHTSDGETIDGYSVTIGEYLPEPGYALTVNGSAIASRWDVAGADFAEYFESERKIDLGYSVVFTEEGKIRVAQKGEKPFGVTSAGAGFVGNSGRPALPWLTNALGDTLYQEVEYVKVKREAKFPDLREVELWIPVDKLKEIPENAERILKREPIRNPDYGKAYLPYRNNPAMVLVGSIGQIPLRKGQSVNPNWVKIKELDEDTELWLVK